MKVLHIDIETYSSTDLATCGVYKYIEDPDYAVLLFAFAIDDDPVQVVDLAHGDRIPPDVMAALCDPTVKKVAHNANFERVGLTPMLRREGLIGSNEYIDPAGWRCTMVHAASLGLPKSLAEAGSALGLNEQKMGEGKELIRRFCIPQRPTKANGERTRILPEDDPEAWEVFKAYNRRDVEVERAIYQRLSRYPMTDSEWCLFELDQRINDRGIAIDLPLVEQAICMGEQIKAELNAELANLTKLDNPNSTTQMKKWLADHGVQTASLDKDAIASLLARDLPPDVRKALTLRQQAAKSSLAKYEAMRNAVCADGRIRGLLQFYGAGTGRWAGRIIQPQNLPRPTMSVKDLDYARRFVREGDYDAMRMLYPDSLDTLSQLIRTALVPADGHRFIVSDFSAIEARVLAYLTGETWRLNAFRRGEDIYCASASKMFGVPVVKHGINGHLRSKGKLAELGLGFGSGINGMIRMGALNAGLSKDELESIVRKWRAANPHIVQFWYDLQNAAIEAVKWQHPTAVNGIGLEYRADVLWITLPSGRMLAYAQPRVGVGDKGFDRISYTRSQNGKWSRTDTYGGKLAENVTQAIARDVLAYALTSLDTRGYRVVCHVHDEVIVEAPLDVDENVINDIMALTPDWAKGLPLKAEGFSAKYYRKD